MLSVFKKPWPWPMAHGSVFAEFEELAVLLFACIFVLLFLLVTFFVLFFVVVWLLPFFVFDGSCLFIECLLLLVY